jgi:hypothetical protein
MSKHNFQIQAQKLGRKKGLKGRTKANYNKTSSMNNNENISPIQGPSTVSCMIASYLSQLTH